MKRNSVLFVGCGDIGVRSGVRLLAKDWQVAGLRRDPTSLPEGFMPCAGDYTESGTLDFIAELQPQYIVATFNPSDRSEEGYFRGFAGGAQNLLVGLGRHRPRLILLVSSTRVYSENAGGWVDEAAALAVHDPRARAIIAAEQTLLESVHPVSVVRFAGIYGYPGGRLLERIKRGELSPREPQRFSNRIHRDDCAGFLCHLLECADSGQLLAPVYNGVDDLPAPQFEVDSWLAAALAQRVTLAEPQLGEAHNPLVSVNKRCSNHLLHASGYELEYPDYRTGYKVVLGAAE